MADHSLIDAGPLRDQHRRRGRPRQGRVPGRGSRGPPAADRPSSSRTTPRAACRSASWPTGASAPWTAAAPDGVEDHLAEQREWFDRLLGRERRRDRSRRRELARCSRRVRFNLFHSPRPRPAPSGRASRPRASPAPATRATTSGTPRSTSSPFLTYTSPRLARNLLHFRVRMLPAARRRAREIAQNGALFPWRTINGEEASAYYAAGTAQYHIDADIAYALAQVRRRRPATRSSWPGRRRHPRRDRAPVGRPRLLAQQRRRRAVPHPRRHRPRRVHDGRQQQPVHQRHGALQPRARPPRAVERAARRAPAGLRRRSSPGSASPTTRSTEWRSCRRRRCTSRSTRASASTRRTTSSSTGRSGTSAAPRPRTRPLLLHYHPLVIYRFQVLKQADVVLALFLQGDRFSAGGEAGRLRVLRPHHHRGLDALGRRAVRSSPPRSGTTRPRSSTSAPRSTSTSRTCTTTPSTVSTSPPPAGCGPRSSPGSVGCATMAGC